MRKLLSWMVALAFALSLGTGAAAPAGAVEPAVKAPAGQAAAKKVPKSHRLTGTVEGCDAATGTFTVKGKKGSVRLRAGEKVALDKIAVGDKVHVKYSGDTALSVNKVPVKKAAGKVARRAHAVPAAAAGER